MEELAALVATLLAPVPPVQTEAAAIELVVAHRWPAGPVCVRCGAACSRNGVRLTCSRRHRRNRFTIFVGTPFASLRCPRVLALLLALRAIVMDHRGIGARPLARCVGMPHVTLWRHIHRLRALLPPSSYPETIVAEVQVCGRDGGSDPASVIAGMTDGRSALAAEPGDDHGLRSRRRLVGESVRTWLNGTFHGVTARWLPLYVCEIASRADRPAAANLQHVLGRLLRSPAARPRMLTDAW